MVIEAGNYLADATRDYDAIELPETLRRILFHRKIDGIF